MNKYLILTTVFLLGIGFAFNAPVWASIVPEITFRPTGYRLLLASVGS